jgi:hypothetical protein
MASVDPSIHAIENGVLVTWAVSHGDTATGFLQAHDFKKGTVIVDGNLSGGTLVMQGSADVAGEGVLIPAMVNGIYDLRAYPIVPYIWPVVGGSGSGTAQVGVFFTNND